LNFKILKGDTCLCSIQTTSPCGFPHLTLTLLGIIKEVPNLNIILGVAVGLFAGAIQQYLNHFVEHTKLMLKHYEPPTNFAEVKTFIS